jgi:hypothetical protein
MFSFLQAPEATIKKRDRLLDTLLLVEGSLPVEIITNGSMVVWPVS